MELMQKADTDKQAKLSHLEWRVKELTEESLHQKQGQACLSSRIDKLEAIADNSQQLQKKMVRVDLLASKLSSSIEELTACHSNDDTSAKDSDNPSEEENEQDERGGGKSTLVLNKRELQDLKARVTLLEDLRKHEHDVADHHHHHNVATPKAPQRPGAPPLPTTGTRTGGSRPGGGGGHHQLIFGCSRSGSRSQSRQRASAAELVARLERSPECQVMSC
jgi:hypothetical protein